MSKTYNCSIKKNNIKDNMVNVLYKLDVISWDLLITMIFHKIIELSRPITKIEYIKVSVK